MGFNTYTGTIIGKISRATQLHGTVGKWEYIFLQETFNTIFQLIANMWISVISNMVSYYVIIIDPLINVILSGYMINHIKIFSNPIVKMKIKFHWYSATFHMLMVVINMLQIFNNLQMNN